MNIKKFISIILCILTISSSITLPTSAAKSANLKNTYIVNKVKMFNESKLYKLDWYIWQISIKNSITEDLIVLYQKLDNLVVDNIDIANELNEPFKGYLYNSIGSQLDHLFSLLDAINNKLITDTFIAETLAKSTIKCLMHRIDQIFASKTFIFISRYNK